VERVLNLLALLLETRVPLTREEILREVAGYPEQVSANRRAFERDKETLRGMGVPITTEAIGDGTEVGYRVRPDDYYLPDFGLTAEETAALHVAVSAVSLGDQTGAGALMKLGGGVGEPVAPIASLPIAPALATFFEAFRRRAVVTFTYRGTHRSVEVWGLSSKRGHWYVVGFDRDRGAIRAFRADRVDDDVTVGEPDAFVPPDEFHPDDHVEARPWLLGDEPPVAVRIEVDDVQRDAMLAQLGSDATAVEDDGNGKTVIELVVTNRGGFRAFLLGFSDSVRVLGPPEVRADMIAWLEGLAAQV
jgi:proteasome accessory factor B